VLVIWSREWSRNLRDGPIQAVNNRGDLLVHRGGMTWGYVSSVTLTLACPSRSWTTLGCTPACYASVAKIVQADLR
jgi:hypothetical protein